MKKIQTADRQIAALLLSIDSELAAAVLRHLSDERVDEVSRAMRELQEIDVEFDTLCDVYDHALERMRVGRIALGDIDAQMSDVLARAFGDERGKAVHSRARQNILERRPFAMFEALADEDLAEVLLEEHPQIAAVFLAHLDHAKAGQVLAALPTDRRADLVRRVATLDRTPTEMVQRVVEVMRAKVRNLGLTTIQSDPRAWTQVAAGMLNNMGSSGIEILQQLQETDPAIANRVRDEMFTFEDLAFLDARSMQRLLSEIDTRVLATALRRAGKPIEDNVFGNLSARAGALLREERDMLAPMPLSEVLHAQRMVVGAVRSLAERGELAASAATEELV